MNQQVALTIDFTVDIPNQKGRFGRSSKQIYLGNWFPILAVYDEHGWNLPPYSAEGESFYSVTGDYHVVFEVPADMKVIATGESIPAIDHTDVKEYQFTANHVRDFAAVIDKDLQALQASINGIDVHIYYQDKEQEQAKRMLHATKKALNTYDQLFGPYRWESLDIVSVDYSASYDGGMEYPQLVTINTPHLDDQEELDITVMHEVGHQWFYSAIGNNQYLEPWLDESLTTFASYIAYDEFMSLEDVIPKECTQKLTASLAEFAEGELDCYGEIMYDGGAEMLYDLRDELGDEVFYKGIAKYYKDYTFKIATTADFIRIMEEVSGENLKPFFTAHRVFITEADEHVTDSDG